MLSLRRQYIAFFAGIVFFLYEYILRVAPGVMTEDMERSFGIDASVFAVMNSMFFQTYLWMQIPVGFLLDTYKTGFVLSLACLCCAAGTIFFAETQTIFLGILARLLIGFGASFGFVGALKIAAFRLPKSHFLKAFSLLTAIGFGGAVIGDNLITYFLRSYSWQEIFHFLGPAGIILAIILWKSIPDYHTFFLRREPKTFAHVKRGFHAVIRNSGIRKNGIVAACYYFPTGVFAELFGQSYLRTVQGLTSGEATFAVTAVFTGWAIGAIGLGKFGERKRYSDIDFPGWGGIIGAVSLASVLYVPNLSFPLICMLLMLFGIGSSSQIISYNSIAKIVPSGFSGVAFGFTNMLCVLGGAVCQPIVAFLLDLGWTGEIYRGIRVYESRDYQVACILLPTALLIGACLSFSLKKLITHETKNFSFFPGYVDRYRNRQHQKPPFGRFIR